MTDPSTLAQLAKVRCFGNKAALCLEESITRGGGHTVMIEVAARFPSHVDWKNKIQVQVTATELPLLASVMLGFLPVVDLKRSGKGILIERQSTSLFVKASMGRIHALPIVPGSAFGMSTLVLNQLKKNHPNTDTTLLLAGLRSAAQLVAPMSR